MRLVQLYRLLYLCFPVLFMMLHNQSVHVACLLAITLLNFRLHRDAETAGNKNPVSTLTEPFQRHVHVKTSSTANGNGAGEARM